MTDKPVKKSKAPAGQEKRNFFATLSADVIKSIKRAAVDEETTASEILDQAAREWLERRKHKTSKSK